MFFLPKMAVFIFHGDSLHPHGIHIEPLKKNTNEANQIQAIQKSLFTPPTRGSDTRGDSLAANAEGGCKSRPIIMVIHTRWFKLTFFYPRSFEVTVPTFE